MPHLTIEQAIEDIKNGRMVILVDDEDRENEGDLTMAAEAVTPEAINYGQIRAGAHLPVPGFLYCGPAGSSHDGGKQHFPVRDRIHRVH